MAVGHALADDEDVWAVDCGSFGEGIVADLEGEEEGATVAESFFLSERAVLEAAAGVVGVGHVEDQGWRGVRRSLEIECRGNGIGIDYADLGR